jgi:RNA polymerase sigma-70 factor (ECF subfamily)
MLAPTTETRSESGVSASPPAPDALSRDGVDRALAGDRAAQRALMLALLPFVQRRVNAALVRRAAAGGGRPVRQEVLDLTQDVFVALFENDARALRRWDPAGGAALTTWVARIAEHVVASVLRSGRRSPWTETPLETGDLERVAGQAPSAHDAVADRQQLGAVLDTLSAELSPLGYELFVELVVEQRDVDDVCRARGMTPNAVYLWRNRLKKAAQETLARLTGSRRPARMDG